MLCYIETVKDLCSKIHDMEKSKVKKAMTEQMSLVDKLLGTGEERVMFRLVIYLYIYMVYMISNIYTHYVMFGFQMAIIALETVMAGAVCLYWSISDDLHGVQVLPDRGAAAGGGEADQVVQAAVNRYR
jgi:hypothetical protein